MADEPTTPVPAPEQPAAPAAEAPPTAADAPIEPTPSQSDSKAFTAKIDREIEDLWALAEGRTQPEPEPPRADDPAPAPEAAAPKPAATEQQPTTDTTTDPAELRRLAYEEAKAKIEADDAAKADAEARIRAEHEYRQRIARWVGSPDDRRAVSEALEAANLGDARLLDALDVTLPNGKLVSEVRDGLKGLTTNEAQNLLTAWSNADQFGDALADRKVRAVIDLWTRAVNSAAVLDDPDVDGDAVRREPQPDAQMRALRESVRDRVTARLTEAHKAELAERDATITEQAKRIDSLTGERANLTAAARGQTLATPERAGEAGRVRRDLPSPEEFAAMSADEAFKTGALDRVLQSIPGGLAARRAG